MPRYIRLGAEGDDKVLEPRPFEEESELQSLLFKNPELAIIDEHGIPIRWAREFHTDAGYADLLVLTSEGACVVVEAKLQKNTDKRQVVAQALDYASQIYRMGIVGLKSEWQSSEYTADLDEEEEYGWENWEERIDEGRIDLSIVMDEPDEQLKDLVVFLNSATEMELRLLSPKVLKTSGEEVVVLEVWPEVIRKKTEEDGKKLPTWEKIERLADRQGAGDFLEAVKEAHEIEPDLVTMRRRQKSIQIGNWLDWYFSSDVFSSGYVQFWPGKEKYEALRPILEERGFEVKSWKEGSPHMKAGEWEPDRFADPELLIELTRGLHERLEE